MKKPEISNGRAISDGRVGKMRGNSMTKEEFKMKLVEMKARDMEILTGIFKNNEIKGAALKFQLKKYAGEYPEYHLEDGKHYALPRYVVNHINNDTCITEYARPDGTFGEAHEIKNAGITAAADGRVKPLEYKLVTKKNKRFEFYSLDFMSQDSAFNTNPLSEVQV